MPVAKAASYHGYDVTDYTTVEPDYGDEAALQGVHRRGARARHPRDRRYRANHTSIDHPWFQDALKGGPPSRLVHLVEADPGWPAVAGPNPVAPHRRGRFYYGAFWEGIAGPQPALTRPSPPELGPHRRGLARGLRRRSASGSMRRST
jgi:glycosidase